MELYLKTLGWWNLIGAILMFAFLSENIGNKILVQWSGIFTEEYSVNYYVKFWLVFAIGLNIFYGLINIMAGYWNHSNTNTFIACFNVIVYSVILLFSIWGLVAGKCGTGIYVGFVIFAIWILWGINALNSSA